MTSEFNVTKIKDLVPNEEEISNKKAKIEELKNLVQNKTDELTTEQEKLKEEIKSFFKGIKEIKEVEELEKVSFEKKLEQDIKSNEKAKKISDLSKELNDEIKKL